MVAVPRLAFSSLLPLPPSDEGLSVSFCSSCRPSLLLLNWSNQQKRRLQRTISQARWSVGAAMSPFSQPSFCGRSFSAWLRARRATGGKREQDGSGTWVLGRLLPRLSARPSPRPAWPSLRVRRAGRAGPLCSVTSRGGEARLAGEGFRLGLPARPASLSAAAGSLTPPAPAQGCSACGVEAGKSGCKILLWLWGGFSASE